jgi:hypothetical protein
MNVVAEEISDKRDVTRTSGVTVEFYSIAGAVVSVTLEGSRLEKEEAVAMAVDVVSKLALSQQAATRNRTIQQKRPDDGELFRSWALPGSAGSTL